MLNLTFDIFIIAISCFWIMKACDPFEEAADYLGRNMPLGIKGATINAIASSAPEFFTTVIFLIFFKKEAGFAAGIATTAGSAIFNAMAIPAACILTALLTIKKGRFNLSKKVLLRDCLFLLCAQFFLIWIMGKQVLIMEYGLILLLIYLLYIAILYYQYKKEGGQSSIKDKDTVYKKEKINTSSFIINFIKFDYKNALHKNREFTAASAMAVIFLAVLNLIISCYLLGSGIVNIAEYFGIGTFFVAIVLAAAATSIPDAVMSIKDAKKGNYDDSISNVLGSNIFDLCICLGLPLFLYSSINQPIVLDNSEGINGLRVALPIMTAAVLLTFLFSKKLGYFSAFFLLSIYLFYIVYSWSMGMGSRWAVILTDKIACLVNAFFIVVFS